jgi:hypothetical protein
MRAVLDDQQTRVAPRFTRLHPVTLAYEIIGGFKP